MIEAGVPKENLALLAIPMVPIQILLPVYISRYTAGILTFVHEGALHSSEHCKFYTSNHLIRVNSSQQEDCKAAFSIVSPYSFTLMKGKHLKHTLYNRLFLRWQFDPYQLVLMYKIFFFHFSTQAAPQFFLKTTFVI